MSSTPNFTVRSAGARSHVKLLCGILVAGLMGLTLQAAQAAPRIHEREGVIPLETSYHRPSDTYFQLVQDWKTTQGVNWSEARARATHLTYRGRVGRLAVIRSGDLFAWMLQALPLSAVQWGEGATWIGLRYWCAANQLMWVDMKPQERGSFAPWAVPWNRGGGGSCVGVGASYMGVYHLGTIGRWQAVGPAKRFPHYIVEYPPVAPPTDDQSAAAGAGKR